MTFYFTSQICQSDFMLIIYIMFVLMRIQFLFAIIFTVLTVDSKTGFGILLGLNCSRLFSKIVFSL